jgi:predicted nucleotide-binding protein (sugar kinase/HSP70/actin superfamily)
MTYNFDEKISDNHYNCPVVAYYPEVLKSNMKTLSGINFMMPYFDVSDKRLFAKKFIEYFGSLETFGFGRKNRKTIKNAVEKAYKSQALYFEVVLAEGKRAAKFAEENDCRLIVLCGRPYHADPEINHGINKIFNSLKCVTITEDAASAMIGAKPKTKVLNQWTYHARLYSAARFAAGRKNTELVQLVSFGCGIDAITADEVCDILESSSKLYTQIKIDEINNLGAAKLRIRSMLAAAGGADR